MSDTLMAGQSVLVTGANRGIGWATCQVLAHNGCHVWAASRSPTPEWPGRLQQLAEDANTEVRPVQLDVDDTASIRAAFSEVKTSGIPLTGLVNNAGITHNALLQMTKVDDVRDLFETNALGVLQVMQGAARLMMRQRSGAIVNVSSTAAIDGNPGRASYGASKNAVITLTRGAAREWAAYGIRVNSVAPGVTRTDMLDSMTPEVLAQVEATTDLQRCGEPEEIAQAIVFLVSPLSSFVSGQVLRVDGGMWV